jgi:hypothetical protein
MREGAQASRRVRVVGVALQAPHRELGGREVAGGHNHEHALARIFEEVHLAMDTHVVEGAALRVSAAKTSPSLTSMPTQYVMAVVYPFSSRDRTYELLD